MRHSNGLLLACLLFVSLPTWAATPAELLAQYQAPGFKADAKRGREFFQARHPTAQGEQSCASCHTSNPLNPGKTRIGKIIEPLAPAANPSRFTDPAKVEKWFRRNCGDVLGRECSAAEKADFIAYLTLVK